MLHPAIYYVLNNRWPTIKAYGLQVAKTCQGLKQAGSKVRLIVPTRAPHKEILGIDPYELYGIRDQFRIIRIPSLDVLGMGLNGRTSFAVQQAIFGFCASIYLFLRQSTVYSRDQFTLYLLSFFRRNMFWEVHRLPEDTDSRVYRRLLACVRGIIVISEGIKRGLMVRGISADKILVAPDGVDLTEFSGAQILRTDIGLDGSRHNVMYVGQLFDWKGVDTLIAAAQSLDERFQVIIIGGSTSDQNRLKTADTFGRVRFEPFMPHQQAIQWMRAADILILPNKKDGGISEFYTSPMKMFEYMASGIPIVASDLPSLREVLNEGNAILVAPDDAKSLAAGISRAANDPEHAKAIATQALRDVEQFSWHRRGKRILDFIAQRQEIS